MTQLDLDICGKRHKGADTSVEAFESTPSEHRARQRRSVLAAVRASDGLTTEEVALALNIAYTAASARMSVPALVVEQGYCFINSSGMDSSRTAAIVDVPLTAKQRE